MLITPSMLVEMPRSRHSSSSSSEDSLLHCSNDEFNTSPDKLSHANPSPKAVPTVRPVSPVGMLAARGCPPLKFTFGATDVRLRDATKSSTAGDPNVTPRVPLKTIQPCQVAASTPHDLTVTIQGRKPMSKHHCPICLEECNTSLHRHSYQCHVPWYADPSRVCWKCFQSFRQHTQLEVHLKTPTCAKGHFRHQAAVWVPHINRLFFKIAQGLGLPNRDALTSFVTTKHPKFLAAPRTIVEDCDAQMYRLLEQTNHTYPRQERTYRYNPPPCWAALLQWRTVASLIQLLPSSLRTELMEVPRGPAESPTSQTVPSTPTSTTTTRTARRTASSSPVKALKAAKTTHTTTSSATVPSLLAIRVPSSASQPKVSSKQQGSGDLKLPRPASSTKLPLLGADAHLHVPELLKRARVSDLSAAITRMPPPESFRLDTLVPSYCWPNQWLDSTDALPRESKYIAVGWHPTRAHEFQNTSLQQFRSALNIPNVVALGEVGLDYHREASPTGRAQQQTLLSNMCQLAHQYNLPLVVHCRDPDDHQSTTAAEDCMVILSEHLHRYHPVYLHCYNQGLPTFCRWLQVFPEVVLGLSPWP